MKNQIIREASNVVRWRPVLAIQWMEQALARSFSPLTLDKWNKAAKSINETLDSIESTRYYSKESFWEGKEPVRLELQEVNITLVDYFAMQQFQQQ